jgi:DNA primase
MANPGDFAYNLKQQADIVRIVGEYVKLKKSGAQNFSGLCPFHQEKTPSFSVHATRQFYHCFGCGASGDVFSFVQKIENLTFPEAVRRVAEKLGVPLPKQSFATPAEARDAKLRGTLLDLHERACAFFEQQLRRPEAAHAREYLAGRGLTDDTIRHFRLGFAPDSGFLLRDALKGSFDEETLKASGLFSWKEAADHRRPTTDGRPTANDQRPTANDAPPGDSRRPAALYSKFRNRITFPIANEAGKVIAFTGRTLATDEKSGPKYLNSPETAIYSKGRVLYNLDRAKEAIRKLDYAVLVEGQMDCISVFAAGFHNVLASSGTAFTEAQAKLLGRFSKNLVVNFDPDAAGAAAAERSLALLVEEEFQIKVLTLEKGFDPDLFLRKKGKDAYAQALRGSERYFDYLIERARQQFPVRTAEGKVKAVNYLLPHVHRVPSRIVRDELANDIAQKLGIDSTVLRQELRHAASTRSSTVKTPAEAQVTPAERILIRALATPGDPSLSIEEADLPAQARYTLTRDRLHEGLVTETLLEILLQAEADVPDLMALPFTDSDRALLAQVLMHEEEELTPELLKEACEALRRRHLEREKQQLKQQIAEAERRQDQAALARLVEEKLRIDRTLAGQ